MLPSTLLLQLSTSTICCYKWWRHMLLQYMTIIEYIQSFGYMLVNYCSCFKVKLPFGKKISLISSPAKGLDSSTMPIFHWRWSFNGSACQFSVIKKKYYISWKRIRLLFLLEKLDVERVLSYLRSIKQSFDSLSIILLNSL